jgi:hypothetical protein
MTDRYGELQKCSICGEYGWSKTHRCLPLFHVWYQGDETRDDATSIYAGDDRDAAERFVEHNDCMNADYLEREIDVVVSPVLEPDEQRVFTVKASYAMEYNAWPKKVEEK